MKMTDARQTKFIQDNFRVIAYPDDFLIRTKPGALAAKTRELKKEIERHCDSFSSVHFASDRKRVCVFCEEDWEGCVDENDYPWCCGKAQSMADELGIKPVPEPVVHIVFDGPPGPESGRFIETETPDGKGIGIGRWEQKGDYWHLIIPLRK